MTDFCGDKTLKVALNNTESTWFNTTNKDYIYFSPPADTIDFGIAQATVLARMGKYNNIESAALSFTVTTLGSIVPTVQD